jgi:hypothetical protein
VLVIFEICLQMTPHICLFVIVGYARDDDVLCNEGMACFEVIFGFVLKYWFCVI